MRLDSRATNPFPAPGTAGLPPRLGGGRGGRGRPGHAGRRCRRGSGRGGGRRARRRSSMPADAPVADVSYDRWDDRWGQSLGDVTPGDLPTTTSELFGGLDAPSERRRPVRRTRMRTLLTPTESGTYRFYLSGDDDARLFVNTTGDDPGRRQRAWPSSPGGPRSTSGIASPASGPTGSHSPRASTTTSRSSARRDRATTTSAWRGSARATPGHRRGARRRARGHTSRRGRLARRHAAGSAGRTGRDDRSAVVDIVECHIAVRVVGAGRRRRLVRGPPRRSRRGPRGDRRTVRRSRSTGSCPTRAT